MSSQKTRWKVIKKETKSGPLSWACTHAHKHTHAYSETYNISPPKTTLCFLKVRLLLHISRFHKHLRISLQPPEREAIYSHDTFWFWCCCFEGGLHCAAYSGLKLMIPYLNLLSVRTASNWHHIQLNSYNSTSVLQKH